MTQENQTYTFEVDHDKSVEEMVKAGEYDYVSSDLTSENFPSTCSGVKTIEAHLVHYGRFMTDEEITSDLDGKGLRDCSIKELLAFGANPDMRDLQRELPIIARRSVWTDPLGYRRVPALWSFAHERSADLWWLVSGWHSDVRFLAVRK